MLIFPNASSCSSGFNLPFLFCLLVKHNALELPFSPSQLFRSTVKFGEKNYFTDHRTANKIQLFVAIKGNLFFVKKSQRRGFPRGNLINVATCEKKPALSDIKPRCNIYTLDKFLFSACTFINKSVLEWFLLIMCKDHTLSRYTNLSRNHPIVSFWLRRESWQIIKAGLYD